MTVKEKNAKTKPTGNDVLVVLANQIKENPNNPRLLEKFIVTLFNLKHFKELDRLLHKLLARNPQNKYLLYYRGLTNEKLKNFPLAARLFRAALAVDPSFNPPRIKLEVYSTWLKKQREKSAGRKKKVAVKSQPTDKNSLADIIDSSKIPDEKKAELSGELILEGNRGFASVLAGLPLKLFGGLFLAVFSALFLGILGGGHYRPPQALVAIWALFFIVIFLGIVLDSLLEIRGTRYRIYERRIDIKKGGLFRSINSIWMYEIEDAVFQCGPWKSLMRDCTIRLKTQQGKYVKIRGLGSEDKMEDLWHKIRDASLKERRAMKKLWI